jgi:anoctamin-10
MQLRRADTTLSDDTELANVTYNDKYVVVYSFAESDTESAIHEVRSLLADLHAVGLNTEVRRGYDQTLLVFVQAPRELLGSVVYKAR